MVKRACCGSIHRRRSSSDKIRSFFLKVQLHLQLADLFVELVLFGLGLLVHLLATVAEDVGQTGQRQLLPSTDLRRVNAEDLRDLSGCLVRLDGLHSNFGLQAGRVILTRSGHCLSSSILNAAHHLTKGLFRVQILGSITVPAEVFSSEQAVRNYKSLSGVERAFRSLKTVDLHVRPIHHRQPDRVRTHIFLCMLAYHGEWHMRQDLAPLLFDDDDKAAAQQLRTSVVAPAQRSTAAQQKAHSRRTQDDLPVHSFQTLLHDLATIVSNCVQPKDAAIPTFDFITTPTALQQRALDLLRVPLKPSGM